MKVDSLNDLRRLDVGMTNLEYMANNHKQA